MIKALIDETQCFLFVPISSAIAIRNFHRTIAVFEGNDIKYLFRHVNDLENASLSQEVIEKLRPIDGRFIIWGAKSDRSINKKYHTYMIDGKVIVVLYYRPTNIYVVGKVVTMVDSEALAEHLWGRNADGSTWRYIYFIEPIAIVGGLDFKELRNLVRRLIIGHTFVCRGEENFEVLQTRLLEEVSRAMAIDNRGVRRYTRERLVSLRSLGVERFIDVVGRVIKVVVAGNSQSISRDVCLDVAGRAVVDVAGSVSDVRDSYAIPICNDLRRLCVLSIDTDGNWESGVSANIAPIGMLIRDIYSRLSEIQMNGSEEIQLLASLAILLCEYRDRLRIPCPVDTISGNISSAKSDTERHAELVNYSQRLFREIVSRHRDLLSAISIAIWLTLLRQSR